MTTAKAKLDWMVRFVAEVVEPLDLYFRDTVSPFDRTNATADLCCPPGWRIATSRQ